MLRRSAGTRASAVRLVHRLESRNNARLVSPGPGSPSLTAQGQLLLRTSMDLHGSLGTFAAATPLDRCAMRIASSLVGHVAAKRSFRAAGRVVKQTLAKLLRQLGTTGHDPLT